MKRTSHYGLILLFAGHFLFGQTPSGPRITGISNSASGAPGIASGSWVTIYGTGLSVTTRSWQSSDLSGNVLPATLDNVSVQINGKKAAIAYVSPGQLNVQAPTDSTTGTVQVQVTNPNGTATGTATLQDYAPAFFAFQAKYPASRHNTDGVYVTPAGFFGTSTASRPAVPGEIVQIYGTGFGPTTPSIPAGQLVASPAPLSDLSKLRVTVGGVDATVLYAGIVAPGQYQVNLIVPLLPDGDKPIVATIGGVSSQSGLSIPVSNAGRAPVALTLAPIGRTIRCSTTQPLAVTVTNTNDKAVIWQINGIPGGNSSVGTVSTDLVYTAPDVLPNPASVTVTAVSHFDPTVKASVSIALQNALPVVSSVTPNPLNPGNATITVNGTGFATGATVYFAGTAMATTFVSSTKLTITSAIAVPVGRLAAVKVSNPNPGAATSAPIAVPVRPATEKMPYAKAVRFLEMTTWGPAPQSVADLQTAGADAWLSGQFAKPASKWPDPNNNAESVTRLQTAFWNAALSGDDQLRQRAAFALSQLLVVSAVKDTQFQQMVSYQRIMGDYAFGSYRDAVTATTLNPAMGDYLDMVNNDKPNPASNTVANENYARELMQLFTLGLVQLDPQGVPTTSGGATIPVYDQSTVAAMAKVMTGWTYPSTPGFNSIWRNMPYYFAPMVAFQDHHDTTEKKLNLPIPCVIAAGGTVESDLTAALDCLFQQSNVAPFVSYRLIQRFVMSDPPPAYVGRVAGVFQSSRGNLRSVIAAVLTDPEAQNQGTGKLMEPILYATGLLRALNAKVTAPDALTNQTTTMGQTPLAPGTVFNFFMPSYTIPGVTPSPVAPEFQVMNAATALARANFAYRVATNGISSGITVDLANFQDLANNPEDLVEALNQALFRGEMDSAVRAILFAAANGSTSPPLRVRSALYAAMAAPQYQVQR